MGQRSGFSSADIKRLNILYDCGGSSGSSSGSSKPESSSGTYTKPPPTPGTRPPPIVKPSKKPGGGGGGGIKPISPIKPIKPIRPVKNSSRPGFGQAVSNFFGNVAQNIGNAFQKPFGFDEHNQTESSQEIDYEVTEITPEID